MPGDILGGGADGLTTGCEPVDWTMWSRPLRFTALGASRTCYSDSFNFFLFCISLCLVCPLIVCVALCALFYFLSEVWFLCYICICVLCPTLVPLPPGKEPFAIQISINIINVI